MAKVKTKEEAPKVDVEKEVTPDTAVSDTPKRKLTLSEQVEELKKKYASEGK